MPSIPHSAESVDPNVERLGRPEIHLAGPVDLDGRTFRFEALKMQLAGPVDVDPDLGCLPTGCDLAYAVEASIELLAIETIDLHFSCAVDRDRQPLRFEIPDLNTPGTVQVSSAGLKRRLLDLDLAGAID